MHRVTGFAAFCPTRFALFLLFWVGVAPAMAPAWGQEAEALRLIQLRSLALDLNPEAPATRQLGRLEYLGGLILSADDDDFGGYSGLAVDGDGGGLWAVSDRGHWLRLDLRRDAAGLPHGIDQAWMAPLLGVGAAGKLRGQWVDAESLRRDHNGDFLVSFERRHRVLRYIRHQPGTAPGAAKERLPLPAAAMQLPGNGGLESVAVLQPDGAVLLIGEESLPGEAGISPVWLQQGAAWRRLSWRRHGDFFPTDAVGLPDGGLLVLERAFRWLNGWGARVSRVAAADLQAAPDGSVLPAESLAEWSRPYSNDNLEAMDVRRAEDGTLWLYLMSDDNQSPFQRSLLLLFRLPEKG